jgi:hypothetical protein
MIGNMWPSTEMACRTIKAFSVDPCVAAVAGCVILGLLDGTATKADD